MFNLLFSKKIVKKITSVGVSGKLTKLVDSERGAVLRWAEFNIIPCDLKDIIKEKEMSPVDMVFKNYNFQVTRLVQGDFLEKLNTTGSASSTQVDSKEFLELLKNCVNRKIVKASKDIILLIDSNPLDLDPSVLNEGDILTLSRLAKTSGFKEVWFVGVGRDNIFKF